MEKGGGGAPAPTGCFKCGRPGHWSRDCPSSAAAPNPNPNFRPNQPQKPAGAEVPGSLPAGDGSAKAAAGRVPKTRPKLTPELLLSDKGLGYVLRHFPRAFKYHGRGQEVSDLGNLIAMYAQWHAQLIPYYSFDQFIKRAEKVGSAKRVRMCLRELRERVAAGGDPTKLHEPPTENVDLDCEHEMATESFDKEEMGAFDEEMEAEIPDGSMDIAPLINHGANDIEEIFNEVYHKATEETEEPYNASKNTLGSDFNSANIDKMHDQNHTSCSNGTVAIQITEEQRVRMEANRQRANSLRALRAQKASSTAAAS